MRKTSYLVPLLGFACLVSGCPEFIDRMGPDDDDVTDDDKLRDQVVQVVRSMTCQACGEGQGVFLPTDGSIPLAQVVHGGHGGHQDDQYGYAGRVWDLFEHGFGC